MLLWINPFLDDFYRWGKDRYWSDKLSFIKYLDSGKAGMPQNDEEYQMQDEDEEIQKYLKKNTPEWYWKYGFGFATGTLWDGSYSEGWKGINLAKNILYAWEHNKQFPYLGVYSFPSEILLPILYDRYPEGLKDESGKMLRLYEYLQGISDSEDAVYSTQLVQVDIKGIKVFLNSIYFTSQKDKSWCKLSKNQFINWTQRHPMEMKE